MLAAQSVIRAQSPSLQQGEDPMGPGQHDVRGHLANHARIVPVASRSWIRGMAVREQRRAGFYVGSTKASIEAAVLSAITARRTRPERVSRYFACLRRGLD